MMEMLEYAGQGVIGLSILFGSYLIVDIVMSLIVRGYRR